MNSPPRVLIPVSVDPGALLDHPTARDGLVHRQAVKCLEDHAILAVGNHDGDALLDAIAQLDHDSRTKWDKLIKGLTATNRLDRSILGPTRVEDLLAHLGESTKFAELIRVLVASEAAAEAHQVDYATGYRTVNGTDVVLAATIDKAPSLVDAAALGPFPPNTDRAVISERLLQPVAARSGCATVMDPHLFDHVVGTARPPKRDHLEWLVATLARSLPVGSTLALVGDLPNGRRQDDNQYLTNDLAKQAIEAAVHSGLASRRAPITVDVALVHAPARGVRMLNRYMLFDCGFAYEVTHDLPQLGTPRTLGPENVTFRRLSASETEDAKRVASGYTQYKPATALLKWQIRIP